MRKPRSEWFPDARFDEAKQKGIKTVRRTYEWAAVFLFIAAIVLATLIVSFDETKIALSSRTEGNIHRGFWPMVFENIMLALPLALSGPIFIWSWYAYQNAKLGREILESTWHGRHSHYDSIMGHIEEFESAMASDSHGDVTEVRLMLSSLIYGIQDKHGPSAVTRFSKVLQDWLDTLEKGARVQPKLTLYLWQQSDHSEIWGIHNGKEGSDWHRRGNRQTREFFDAMVKMREVILGCSDKVHLTVRMIQENPLRYFLIRRDGVDWGMAVVYANFRKETADQHNFINMGFITDDRTGVDKMFNVAQGFEEPSAGNGFYRDGQFIENIDHYFVNFFELSLVGAEPESWHLDLADLSKRIALFHAENNPSLIERTRVPAGVKAAAGWLGRLWTSRN